MKQYYFHCECERCLEESNGYFAIDYTRMFALEEQSKSIAKQFVIADRKMDKTTAFELTKYLELGHT